MPIAAGERIEFHPQTRGQAFQAEGVPHLATLTFVRQRILSAATRLPFILDPIALT